jgi:hypothetical protein
MDSFPKNQTIQESGCRAIRFLTKRVFVRTDYGPEAFRLVKTALDSFLNNQEIQLWGILVIKELAAEDVFRQEFGRKSSVCPSYPASKGEQCGPSIGSCSKGNCCSKYGYCGSIGLENADVYCSQPMGCQLGYGACFGSASNFCPSQQVLWSTNVKPTTREMSPTDKAEFDAKALEALAKSRDGSPGFIIGIWDPKKGFNMQAYGLSSWNGTKQTVDNNGSGHFTTR